MRSDTTSARTWPPCAPCRPHRQGEEDGVGCEILQPDVADAEPVAQARPPPAPPPPGARRRPRLPPASCGPAPRRMRERSAAGSSGTAGILRLGEQSREKGVQCVGGKAERHGPLRCFRCQQAEANHITEHIMPFDEVAVVGVHDAHEIGKVGGCARMQALAQNGRCCGKLRQDIGNFLRYLFQTRGSNAGGCFFHGMADLRFIYLCNYKGISLTYQTIWPIPWPILCTDSRASKTTDDGRWYHPESATASIIYGLARLEVPGGAVTVPMRGPATGSSRRLAIAGATPARRANLGG